MKVLYIAPYRNGTDITDAAVNYILALDKIGVDVVPRCVYHDVVDVPDRIKELEKKSTEGCDTLVLHTAPAHFEYHGNFKTCVGITYTETNDFCASTWSNKLNLMDKIIVANEDAKVACQNSFVKKPVFVLPYATNVEKFQQSYEPLPEIRKLVNNDFLFYMIAKGNKRKNIVDVLRAFHSEFRLEEPVNLLIKTGAPDLPTEISRNEMRRISENVKRDLRLFPKSSGYKNEIVITEWLSDKEMCSLHNTADCYVAVGSNENWAVPAFDAMAFGKTPIYIPYAGYNQYLSDDTGFRTLYNLEDCFGFVGNSEVYTSNEKWAKPNIEDLRRSMRFAYRLRTTHGKRVNANSMIEAGINKAYEFSYEKVGNQLRELLLNEQQK